MVRFGLGRWLAISVALVTAGSAVSAEQHLPRALYWNTAPYATMSDPQMAAAIAELQARHVDRVHLWLNDQPTGPITCASTFAYAGWTSPVLETFTQKLRAANIGVVFTISPAVPTDSYIASLAEPLGVAKRTGAEVEYDLEGAWTKRYGPQNCGPGGAAPDLAAMEQRLAQSTRAAAEGIRIGLSTTPAHYEDHKTLIAAADWVSPQLYDLDGVQMGKSVTALEKYGAKQIWIAVRVDTTLEKLIPTINAAKKLRLADPKVQGIAVWGRNELTYADRWLRNTN